jgi:arylsulfatase A-like enzyme
MITCHRMLSQKRVLISLCILVAAFGIARAQQVPGGPQGACAQILAACEKAGFVRGGAGSGNGLGADCILPILEGSTERRKTSKPLPHIDPQVIAACNAEGAIRLGRDQTTGTPPPQPAPIAPAHPPAQGSPNIVFILTDDLASNLVQFMPHVLAMQTNGITFTNYFVTDSLCCPSRSSIFTGRYPHDTGVFTNAGEDGGYSAFTARGNDQSTFAVALARTGYRTAFLGKYLNGYQPHQHPGGAGWHHWVVAGNGYLEFDYAFNQDGTLVAHASKPEDYLTDVLAADGVRFIKENTKAPFFIELATFAPHLPYTPAPRDAGAFPDLRAPRGPAYNVMPTSAPRWLISHPALTQEAMDAIDGDFRKRAQSVLAVDKMIDDLQAAVAEIGQEKNTYFVFSSDNGYHMGEYRLMPGKQTAYDTDINVPLVVTGPKIAGGRKAEEIVENIDLAPTFIQLAGGDQFPNVDGASLVPLLGSPRVEGWRTVALVEHHGPVRDVMDPDLPAPRSAAAIQRRTRPFARARPCTWNMRAARGNITT